MADENTAIEPTIEQLLFDACQLVERGTESILDDTSPRFEVRRLAVMPERILTDAFSQNFTATHGPLALRAAEVLRLLVQIRREQANHRPA